MKKFLTLAMATTLAGAALSARAQITLDGVINANEIGTAGNKYQVLGSFTPVHVGNAGFGFFGLLRMYGANSANKLYVGIAGTTEPSGNNFQLYLDLPNRAGVPVGIALPAIAGSSTVFGTFGSNGIGGTKLDLEGDIAVAMTGQGDVQGAVYTSATSGSYTGQAKSLGDGLSAVVANNGTPSTIPAAQASGAYSMFSGMRVAYKDPGGNITTNPGYASGGGAGSTALEYEFDRTALGLPSGASVVKVMVAYVSPDAYWSSDVIPEIPGNGNNNLAFRPDFPALAGTQAASLNVVVLSTRQADDAVVALSVFPNPSRGEATLTYQVRDAAQPVSVRFTDLLGRVVRTLAGGGVQAPGFHDLKVSTGELTPGTYLVQMQVGDKVATRRLTVTE